MRRVQQTNNNNHTGPFHVCVWVLLLPCSFVIMVVYLHQDAGVLGTPTVGLLTKNGTNGGAHDFGGKDDSREPKIAALPNVLFVGVQKSGSTAVAEWILQHDDVCGAGSSPPYSKEVHFFDIPDRYQKGVSAYNSLFRHCENTSLVLDATPGYFRFADRVRKLYYDAGDMHARNLKILVTLRDPVARELSIYNHLSYNARTFGDGWWRSVIKDDGSIMTFSEYVDNVTLHEIRFKYSVSLYAYHLRKWMKAFDRSQILVLSYDELKHDTDRMLARVRKFIGLEEGAKEIQLQRSNENGSKEKVALPTCKDQKKIVSVLSTETDALFDLLRDQPGPPMEQRPFQNFSVSNCSFVDV